MISVGFAELALVGASAAGSLVASLWRQRRASWGIAITACLCVAALVTPADVLSTLLIAIACLACYAWGKAEGSRKVDG